MKTLILAFLSVLIALGISSNIGDEADFKEETRAGVTEKTKLWPNGIVYYTINRTTYQSSRFCYDNDYLKAIQAAIDDYHKYTCIKFIEKDPNDNSKTYWVHIDDFSKSNRNIPPACAAEKVGFERKANYMMNLQNGRSFCSQGTIAHEFGHTIGLSHEHTREDRDYYIQIHEQNIGDKNQFIKDGSPGAFLQKGSTFGLPYNYASIMQYPTTFASSNGGKTMSTKNNRTNSVGNPDEMWWGNAVGITRGDQLLINTMYNCGNNYPQAAVQRSVPSDYCYGVRQPSKGCKNKKH